MAYKYIVSVISSAIITERIIKLKDIYYGMHDDKINLLQFLKQLKKIYDEYNSNENNKRFYKTALEQFYKNDKLYRDTLCVDKIDFSDVRRVLNPPTTLINTNNMETKIIKIFDKKAKVKYLETKHGIYVQLLEPVYDSNVESAFGFGLCCSGFDPNKIVYYPNHKKKIKSLNDALNQSIDPNFADFNVKNELKYSKYV